MTPEILRELESRRDELIDLIRAIVELESPSTDKAAVDRLGQFLARELEEVGLEVEFSDQADYGNHVLGRWNVGDGEQAPVLIVGHIDTVWPVGELEERPFRIDGDQAFGPGVFDMKVGIAMTVMALRVLKKLGREPQRPVQVIFNTEEELGSPTSRQVIEEQAKDSAAALILEPSYRDRAVRTSRKGVGMFEVEVTGRASHSGADHEKGISAVEEMAHQIRALHSLTDYEKGTTINVGVVKGGQRRNVVAPSAWAEVDLRIETQEEAERVVPLILGLKPHLEGAQVKVTGGLNRPPFERTEGVVALYEHARELAAELGFELGESTSGGASDGNFTAAMGVPTLDGLGGAGLNAHSVDEHIYLEELPLRTAFLCRLIETI